MKVAMQNGPGLLTQAAGGEENAGAMRAPDDIGNDRWIVRLDLDALSAAAVVVSKKEAIDVPSLKGLLAQGWLTSFGGISTPKHWGEAASQRMHALERPVRELQRLLVAMPEAAHADSALATSLSTDVDLARRGGRDQGGGPGDVLGDEPEDKPEEASKALIEIRGMEIRFQDPESRAWLMIHTRADLASAVSEAQILYVSRRSELAPIRSDFSLSGAGGI